MKSLSLNVSCFKFCPMLVKKVQNEFAFSMFFTFLMVAVTWIGTDSLERNIFLMQFQDLVGFFLFSNNKSFWYFWIACLTLLTLYPASTIPFCLLQPIDWVSVELLLSLAKEYFQNVQNARKCSEIPAFSDKEW